MYEINYSLSLLIPGWNSEIYIKDCVNSLLKSDYQNFRIILIVGGFEEDNSYKIALDLERKYPEKIIVLEQKIPNKNKALNLGLNEIDGDLVILTDIDCIYQTNWLRRINEIFQNKKYNVITGLYLPFPNQKGSLSEFNSIKHGSNLFQYEQGQEVIGNKLCGANCAFRKEVFLEKIGKFDETVTTGDDKILGIAFNRQGETLYFFRDIYIYSECYSNNLKKFIRRRVRWARDLYITFKKKYIFKLSISLIIALFKLFYPIIAFFFVFFLFNLSYLCLFVFLLPWLILFLSFHLKLFFELKEKCKNVNILMSTNFDYKKAFKIVPLLFFIFGIITILSIIYPRRKKW